MDKRGGESREGVGVGEEGEEVTDSEMSLSRFVYSHTVTVSLCCHN